MTDETQSSRHHDTLEPRTALSDRRYTERMATLQSEHTLTVANEANDVISVARDGTMTPAPELETRLRDRISALEGAVANHEDRINALRNEQNAAVLQIGAALARNEREHAQSRDGLEHLRQETATLARDLQRQKDESAVALAQRREVQDQLVILTAQMTKVQQMSSYLQQVNEAMRASHSWRLTQPLRTAGTIVRSVKNLPKSSLRALNRASQVSYQRLKRSHPKTAELLQCIIRPMMTWANMKIFGQHHVTTSPSVLKEAFAFDYQLPRVYPEFRPLVTVIVPNYNHAAYLTKRLESIFAQTYDNYEVLLLDDCSMDDSRDILNEFAARHPDRTRVLFNEINSGGVFHQWEKGLSEARGDLIWIAESDDWASLNFLETLVPFFQNEAVQLAYARTNFMDATGQNQTWSMEEYLNAFGPERWGRAWVETAPNIVRDIFSVTNIIPNVSSTVFRRFDRLDVLEIEQWRGMRTCGDWMFYLNAIRGGMLAYSPDAQNFYRIHEKNTSVASHKADQFYREHEEVAKCVRRHYSVPNGNLEKMETNLRHHWKTTRDDYSDQAFAACFDCDRIAAAPSRKPTLLMVSYAFCAGGGETFPIQLANEIKATGYEVTFLDCAQEERVLGVRARLATDIPVISSFPDLQHIVKNFDIDLIHSHHGWADNTVLDLLPEDAACRTIITLHGFYETMPPEQLKPLLPRLLRRTSAMVYIAEKNLSVMQHDRVAAPKFFHRIDNAVSKANTTSVDRRTLGIAKNAFVLTVVSRALHTKGWAEAIASTTRAREISGRDIHLVLVGDGEAKDAAEASGVPEYIHLEGFRSNTQDYFAAADLGFLPSRFKGESFPLVVIESLISGTPVLASRVGEISYMLETEEGPAGILFDLSANWEIDIEALAQQIAGLATNPKEMAHLRARVPLAARRFDPRHMAEKYDAVYRGTMIRDA